MRRHLILIALCFVGFVGDGQAQPPSTSLKGVVLDSDGLRVPGVTIEIESDTGHPSFEGTTDLEGQFSFSSVPVGQYHVKAILEGFTAIDGGTITALPGTINEMELRLEVPSFPQPPPPAPVPSVLTAPTWNSWAEEETTEEATATLRVGSSYTVTFDLAGLDYAKFTAQSTLGALPSPALVNALAVNGKKVVLLVKPFLQGEGLRLIEESPPPTVTVQLDKLRQTATLLESLSAADRSDLPTLSDRLNAARIQVHVHAEKPGQSLVGLAIWDSALKQPLDFIAFPAVIRPADAAEDDQAAPPLQLQSGFRALLTSTSSIPADAGIGIFEFGSAIDGSIRSTVVFVGPQGKVRSWSPDRPLSEYVGNPTDFGLAKQLEFASCLAPSSAKDCREDYSGVAASFSRILFSAPDPAGQDAAKQSQDELEKLAADNPNPVVATHFIDAAGATQPMPLGLLGLSSNRLLGDVANVTQPLPEERPVNTTGCISSFATILPTSLEVKKEKVDKLLVPIQPPSPTVIQTFEELRPFLSPSPASTPPQSEGFLLISHHADGLISFNPSFKPRLEAEAITRLFAPGSVAVLIGCSIGSLEPLNGRLPLIRALNRNGIDAMIFSPFTVGAELGARLAVHFSEELEAVRQSKGRITFLQLYQRVLAKVRADDAAKPFVGELGEFLVAGSGNLEFCGADGTK
jgi:hypothetical protein